jgi:hypothetical protein
MPQLFTVLFILFGILMAAGAASQLVDMLLAKHEKVVLEMVRQAEAGEHEEANDMVSQAPAQSTARTCKLQLQLRLFISVVLHVSAHCGRHLLLLVLAT